MLFGAAFPVAYAWATSERRGPPLALPVPPAGSYRVHIADWRYHTAIVVEQPHGWHLGPPGKEGAAFLEYAWGDRRFYHESDFWPQSVFATLFLPTESVLYLDGRADPPRLAGARAVFSRTVDATTLRALLTQLERSIRRGSDGQRAAPLARVPGYSGTFFPAVGTYLWTRDCNWWVVRRLADAGVASGASRVVFRQQVPGRLLGFAPQAAP